MNSASFRKVLLLVLLFSVFAPWTGHPFDMQVWFKTGELLLRGENIYTPKDHYGYPPFWSYWAALSYHLYLSTGAYYPSWTILVKLPQILALILVAFLVTRKNSQNGRPISFRLQLPFWIYAAYVTAIWGQLNALSGLFVLLAVLLLNRSRLNASMASLGAGVAVKLYPIIGLPFFLSKSGISNSWRRAMRLAFALLLVPAGASLLTLWALRWDLPAFFWTLFYQPFSLLCEGCPGPRPLMNFWSLVWYFDKDIPALLPFQLIWLPAWIYAARRHWNTVSLASIVSLYLAFLSLFPRVSEASLLDFLPLLMLEPRILSRSRILRACLFAMPLLALTFIFVNYGLLHFIPLVGQQPTLEIEGIYRAHASVQFLLMGIIGVCFTGLAGLAVRELPKDFGKVSFLPQAVSVVNLRSLPREQTERH